MKRMFALILVLMMIPACCFASERISEEVITVTVSGRSNQTISWDETNMAKVIEERFGIRLVGNGYPDDTWKTQFTLMLAEENLPDIILNPQISLAEVASYGSQGYFLDLKDLVAEHAPNITATMETYPRLRNYSTSPDGNMYTLTQISVNVLALAPRFWLNKNWVENVGMEYPETLDDVYELLKAFKEQDANGNGDANDEIPLDANHEYTISTFLNAFGFNTRQVSYLLQADEDGNVYLGETTEAFKAYLTYMKQLWDEGLMCPEFFTEPGEQLNAQIAGDTVGLFGASAPYVSAGQEIDYDANFYWAGAFTSDYRENATIIKNSEVSGTPFVLVNAKTEHAEEIVKLLDFFYTEEGQVAGNNGFEGVDFDYQPVNVPGLEDKKTFTMYCPDGFASGEAYRTGKAVINNGFYFVKPLAGTPSDAILAATNDEQFELLLPANGWLVQLTRYGINREGVEIIDAFPSLIYEEDEAEERTQLYNDINSYLKNMQTQFITGEADIEGDWDAFIETLNSMGLEKLLEIEQNAYTRLMG
ncbi:MAG: extracellular solute-binding protein [Clostridia bacterium]|nr:extracellular solute-binding protein [Clostridia bacterium]MBQ4158181.1 extracellular solute-binding protein [Clostridia bacterium]